MWGLPALSRFVLIPHTLSRQILLRNLKVNCSSSLLSLMLFRVWAQQKWYHHTILRCLSQIFRYTFVNVMFWDLLYLCVSFDARFDANDMVFANTLNWCHALIKTHIGHIETSILTHWLIYINISCYVHKVATCIILNESFSYTKIFFKRSLTSSYLYYTEWIFFLYKHWLRRGLSCFYCWKITHLCIVIHLLIRFNKIKSFLERV